jgi:hypothetical protein
MRSHTDMRRHWLAADARSGGAQRLVISKWTGFRKHDKRLELRESADGCVAPEWFAGDNDLQRRPADGPAEDVAMPEINFFWDPLSDNILQERDETGAVTAEYTAEPGLYGNIISQNRSGWRASSTTTPRARHWPSPTTTSRSLTLVRTRPLGKQQRPLATQSSLFSTLDAWDTAAKWL